MVFPFVLQAQQKADNVDVPRTISYQGLLTTPGGSTLPDGTYEITVALYADALGQEQVWHDTYQAPVHNGVFNLYLGNGATPLPSSTEMNRPLWVGTSINGSEKMLPLTPLTASPYALNLPDHTITTGKLADGAVTAEKVDMDYISGVTVNGEKITGAGTVLDIRSSDDIAIEYDEVNKSLNISRPHQTQNIDPDKSGAQVLAPSGVATDEVWSKTGDVWDISVPEIPCGNKHRLDWNKRQCQLYNPSKQYRICRWWKPACHAIPAQRYQCKYTWWTQR